MILQFASMDSLARLLYTAPGGIERLLYTPIQDVATIGPVSSDTHLVTSIGLKAGKVMYVAGLPNQKQPYTEDQKTGDGGDYFECVVNGFLPFESQANHLLLTTMKYHQYLVLMKTHSGLIRVIGDIGNGAKFAQSYGSGENTSADNGTAFTFTWQSPDKPVLIASISTLYSGLPPVDHGIPPGS